MGLVMSRFSCWAAQAQSASIAQRERKLPAFVDGIVQSLHRLVQPQRLPRRRRPVPLRDQRTGQPLFLARPARRPAAQLLPQRLRGQRVLAGARGRLLPRRAPRPRGPPRRARPPRAQPRRLALPDPPLRATPRHLGVVDVPEFLHPRQRRLELRARHALAEESLLELARGQRAGTQEPPRPLGGVRPRTGRAAPWAAARAARFAPGHGFRSVRSGSRRRRPRVLPPAPRAAARRLARPAASRPSWRAAGFPAARLAA